MPRRVAGEPPGCAAALDARPRRQRTALVDNGTAPVVTVGLRRPRERPVFHRPVRRGPAGTPSTQARLSGTCARPSSADERQVAVALGVVEPVADDELVRDVEADVPHRHLDLDRLRLAQQRAHLERRRPAGLPGSCSSHDRVRPESMMSSTISTWRPVMSRSRSLRIRTTPDDEVAEPYELTAMNSSCDRDRQRPGEVGHEHHRALEHADQQQVVRGRSSGSA